MLNDNSKSELILDGSKVQWYPERITRWLLGEHIAPITIDLALTRACNFKCRYCYGVLQENKGKKLTWKVLKHFIDDCALIGVKGLSLVADGESTCHPDWIKFILYAKKKGLAIALGTNGSLLDERSLRKVLPALSYLRFNISGGEQRRYCEIMGTTEYLYYKVLNNIQMAVDIKHYNGLDCTIGMQMVFRPEYVDQVLPLTTLALQLEVDYLIIKHCSDDEHGSLGVNYDEYIKHYPVLQKAEAQSTVKTLIKVKWNKIKAGNVREYKQCYGAPFILQISGSGLVTPCGMFFDEKYGEYHIGNISQTRFKKIWESKRYWEVMGKISSPSFNAQTMCGCLCLQHCTNETLEKIQKCEILGGMPNGSKPRHIEFI